MAAIFCQFPANFRFSGALELRVIPVKFVIIEKKMEILEIHIG